MLKRLMLMVMSCAAVACSVACKSTHSLSGANPPSCKTSIGDLISVEKKEAVDTNEGKLERKAGESLYVLVFAGSGEIPFEGKLEGDGFNRLMLNNSNTTKLTPRFAGTPVENGSLSNADWKYEGSMTGAGGKFVFKGTLRVPPKVALVYVVPESTPDLTLTDGAQSCRLNP